MYQMIKRQSYNEKLIKQDAWKASSIKLKLRLRAMKLSLRQIKLAHHICKIQTKLII